MTTEITMSNLWWSRSLMDYFFRKQSEDTLNEVMERIAIGDYETSFDMIDDFFTDLNDCEETFYEMSADEIIKMIGLPTIDDDDDDDGDDEDDEE